ncbi:hypothetical protein K432DRAFT_467162 [Lepidopterella palustris CBS 459.81]|uniref:Uncharacterized protein n=1 Tax=Lepidopterella palustris CBS 459.81 TaxID=1314670 RepID=A0A8E2JAB3_9PEZI|nr:hypothetical protein K432DRAFT_467162 [Lepidopterella palustris CBS 459.81]
MLPIISLLDFDCKPPSHIDEASKTAAVSMSTDIFTETSVRIALLRYLSIRLEITKTLNAFHSEASYDETLRLGAEITAACRSSSRLLRSFISSCSSLDRR